MSDYHSEQVAYYLAKAREAIRQASAENRKRETDRVAPVRAALAAERTEGEEAT